MKLSSRPLRVGAAVVSVASAAVGLKRHTLRNELKPDLVSRVRCLIKRSRVAAE